MKNNHPPFSALLYSSRPAGLRHRLRITARIQAFKLSLRVLALFFTFSKKMRVEINNPVTGFVFNARYQFSTRDDLVHLYMIFENGRVRTGSGRIDSPDVTVFYKDRQTLAEIFDKNPEESLDYLLTNDMSYTGNMAYLTRFSYLTTLLTGPSSRQARKNSAPFAEPDRDIDAGPKARTIKNERLGRRVDKVRFLEDPFLERYRIEDFPRLKYLKNRRFNQRPAVCPERAFLVTRYFQENGFETDSAGNPIDPGLRQAGAMRYLMERKKPVIQERNLLAGSTTSKEVGVPVYPEFIGTAIWSELRTISSRELNPNDLSRQDADILNFEVFPFWMDRNVREHCRRVNKAPLSQQLEERFVLYFMMKNNAISHTIPDFETVLRKGLNAIMAETRSREAESLEASSRRFYRSLAIVIEGVLVYAENLAAEAERLATGAGESPEASGSRRSELLEIARICRRVPAYPPETVHEAVMSIWITFTCLHLENADSALSIGRLDQLLQPCFENDISRCTTSAAREEVVKKTIELVGNLFIRFNDHDPLIPNVGNKLFGGSSSDDTVTVGGVDRNGANAVCDMTYIILKTAEMLCFQDPNLNARYFPGVNSAEYLRRLCEVNINMGASPIIHNDRTMIQSLVHQGFALEDARDWGATGCVEPTVCGRHYGHTNCMLLNMVAPLEMALNDGVHPVIGERIGPATGDVRHDFPVFEYFLSAYKAQLAFLVEQSMEVNDLLGQAHQYIHPTPLLSALFSGPLEKGKDLINGGAVYNSSGVALVSITDVVDSLMVIRQLVYEDKMVGFGELMLALEKNFEGAEAGLILERVKRVPRFGSGDSRAIALAQEIIDYVYELYQSRPNYRGGRYLPGYWSISYHVGFGLLSGALPSGRRKGRPFTPGLTPAPGASDQLLHGLRSVAALDHLKMPNNIAFNVKLVPGPGDSHGQTLDRFTDYVGGYFDLGGMQWQFNVISTDTMKDAMENPADYQWLLVRISGYNAYFVKLNRNMQRELIERTQYTA
ncbi:MAG: pyruvate formate lyase family protein [Desulfosudaceae bacterium]